jgi:hypothetical protein
MKVTSARLAFCDAADSQVFNDVGEGRGEDRRVPRGMRRLG